MSPEEEITSVAEAIIVLEEPGPYTQEERDTFYKASKFLKEWGEMAFQMSEEDLAEDGLTREDAVKSAQPVLAAALELVRLAAGANPTITREHLREHLTELGQMAIKSMAIAQAKVMGIEQVEGTVETDEPKGRAFY